MIELHTYLHFFYKNALLAEFQKMTYLINKNFKLLRHNSVKTTMIYTHVLKTVMGVKSSLDSIL